MIDLSEQGLERLERAIMYYKWPAQVSPVEARGQLLDLISALRQARADPQEARRLLEIWHSLHLDLSDSGFEEENSELETRAFLARTAPREGGETQ